MSSFEEMVVDLAWKNLEIQIKRFHAIETKTIGLMTLTGVLITIMFSSATKVSGFSGNKIFFALACSLFLVSIICSLYVFEHIKTNPLSILPIVLNYGSDHPSIQAERIVIALRDIEEKQTAVCDEKENKFKAAVSFFSTGIMAMIVYIISTST
jgi:hypothetical protein